MKQPASSLLTSTGLLLVVLTLSASSTQAIGAPTAASTTRLSATADVNDLVVLERRFESSRGQCTGDLGVATNRVFPDGTRELFVVPAGMAFVLTDLEGEITEKLGAAWFVGTIGVLNVTLTGGVANQYVRARGPLNEEAVSAGIATLKLHLQSGVVADSGASVCLSAFVVEKNGFRSAHVGTDVRVHGYLIAR